MLFAPPPLNAVIQVNFLDEIKLSSSFASSERKQKISGICSHYGKCTGFTLLLLVELSSTCLFVSTIKSDAKSSIAFQE